MCFSAEVDVALGVAIGAVGIDTLRHVEHRRELPLAALPLVFAAHQLTEAFVWWGLDGKVVAAVGTAAAAVYLAIAFALPVLVPLAVRSVETDRPRRAAMSGFLALGAVVSAVLLIALAAGGPEFDARALHISYSVAVPGGDGLMALYVIATCGPLLVSTPRRLVVFGWLNLLAVVALVVLLRSGVISLWCAWAAVLSVLIALHLRTRGHAESRHFAPVGD